MAHDFDAITDEIDWGVFTAAEGATKATWSYWILPDFVGSASNGRVWGQHSGGFAGVWMFSRNGSLSQIRNFILVGINVNASTPNLTDAVWQHHYWIFDGSQADNATRLRFWLDKVEQTLTYVDTIPVALGSTAGVRMQMGVQQVASSSMLMRLAECYLWIGAAITDDVSIANIYKGCANIVQQTLRELDTGLLVSLPIDRSKNALVPTVTGTTLIAHPPDVVRRGSCTGGGGYMAASYYGLVEPPSGW